MQQGALAQAGALTRKARQMTEYIVLVDEQAGKPEIHFKTAKTAEGACRKLARDNPLACVLAARADEMPAMPDHLDAETRLSRMDSYVSRAWRWHICRASGDWPREMREESKRRSARDFRFDRLSMTG